MNPCGKFVHTKGSILRNCISLLGRKKGNGVAVQIIKTKNWVYIFQYSSGWQSQFTLFLTINFSFLSFMNPCGNSSHIRFFYCSEPTPNHQTCLKTRRKPTTSFKTCHHHLQNSPATHNQLQNPLETHT